ncbi:MAG: GTP-binding protein [Holophaga sp.]|nr:GTP-binding protein [Holophaga sp.]
MAEAQIPPVEMLLVTGPLGSGKTTVVNRLLKEELAKGRRVSMLINEFGSVSVDESLVEAERPELAGIASLVNGCACCSLRGDVVATLAEWCDLPPERRPERIVLETTGLADPTDLLDLGTEEALAGRLHLAGCLTVVSCLTPLQHLKQRDLLHRQVAVANVLYVSKADLDPSQAMAWESDLRAAFKAAAIVQTRLGQAPPNSPDPWAGDPVPPAESRPALPRHGFADARVLCLPWQHSLDPEAMENLFRRPPGPGELLRAKGVASFLGWPTRDDGSDRWAFQLADGRLEIMPLPLRPDGSAVPRVAVVIGRGLDLPAWKQNLAALEGPEISRAPLVSPG